MAHGDAREGKWRGKLANAVGSQYPSHYLGTRCIQHYYRWCAHLGCASSRLNWRPPGWFKWTRPFRAKDEVWFLRVCHHVSTTLAHCFTGLLVSDISKDFVAFIFKCNESIHRLEYHWRWWYSPFKYRKRLTQQLHISQKTQILHLKFVQHWLWMLLFYAISHHVVCYDVYLHFREHCYLRLVRLPGKWR